MSSHGSAAPLVLELRPSRLQRTVLSLGHLLAAVAAVLASPYWLGAAMLPVLALSLRHTLRLAQRRRRLIWHADGGWRWHDEQGGDAVVELLPDSYLNRWLVVLNFRAPLGRRSLVVWPDSIDADTFRRLRARLRVSDNRAQPAR